MWSRKETAKPVAVNALEHLQPFPKNSGVIVALWDTGPGEKRATKATSTGSKKRSIVEVVRVL
jgi:hypothetical protein